MAAGIASTLLFVYPIMVALIMAMVFKEKLALQTMRLHAACTGRYRTALQERGTAAH